MRIFVSIILLFCGYSSSAQFTIDLNQLPVAKDGRSLLWKIEGKELTKPSFFYGTFHVKDEAVFCFDSLVMDVLFQAEQLALELDLEKISFTEIMEAIVLEKPLKDQISTEKYDLLDSLLKAASGMDLSLYGQVKPVFLGMTLGEMGDTTKGDREVPLDMYFLEIAKARDIPIHGLETLQEQIGAFDVMSVEQQTDWLIDLIEHPEGNSMNMSMDSMIHYYRSSDIDKMAELINDSDLPKELTKALLDQRNTIMVNRFLTLAAEATTFAAVGAGHLGGENGIIKLLKEKGYKVTPVRNNFRTTNCF